MSSKECFECGAPATEDHHVIPQSLGGTKTVPLCGCCHDRVHEGGWKRRDNHSALTKVGQAKARAEGKRWGFGTATHPVNHVEIIRLSTEATARLKLEFAESVIDTLIQLRNQLLSLNEIADELNKRGVKTARGKNWYATTVSNTFDTLGVPFRDRTFLGKLSYTKQSVTDESNSTQTEQTTSLPSQS